MNRQRMLRSGFGFLLGMVWSLPLLAAGFDGNPYRSGYDYPSRDEYRRQDSRPLERSRNPYGFAPPRAREYGYGGGAPGGVITVVSRQIGAKVVIGGTVIPYREVTLTAQLPGRVEFIAGEEGDRFRINQVLVALDDDDLLAKRRQILAELQATTYGYTDARLQYAREFWSPGEKLARYFEPQRSGSAGLFPSMFERFFGGGGGYNDTWRAWRYGNPWIERQVDLYSRGTHVGQASSRVLAMRAKIDEIDAKLIDTRSIAPFDGVILKKLVEVGDTVQPGQPLIKYADTNDLQIQLEVPARLMPGLHLDMILPATLDVGDMQVNARVAQIFPVADSLRHTVTVKLDLPQGVPGGPGMYAEVAIPDASVPESSVPVIPASAIVWRGSLPAVFVVTEGGKPSLRLVRLGQKLEQDLVAVLSGLRAGERILASPPPGMNSNWVPRTSDRR